VLSVNCVEGAVSRAFELGRTYRLSVCSAIAAGGFILPVSVLQIDGWYVRPLDVTFRVRCRLYGVV
jgi:hypothetical protein